MEHETTGLLADTYFWTAISFVIFCGLAFVMGRKTAMNGVDAYIAHIRARIQEAEGLHKRAADQAKDYARRYADAADEAKDIVAQAADEAKSLIASGQADLQKRLDTRQKQFDAELKQMEDSAMAELRARMAEMVEQMVREQLKANWTAEAQAALIDQSIQTAAKSAKAA